VIWTNVTASLSLQQNCAEYSLKELSKNQYLSTGHNFPGDQRYFKMLPILS